VKHDREVETACSEKIMLKQRIWPPIVVNQIATHGACVPSKWNLARRYTMIAIARAVAAMLTN